MPGKGDEVEITIRAFRAEDALEAAAVWNEVVEDGVAFPQTESLTEETGRLFFEEQTYTGIAVNEQGTIVGLYILHPNNVGRCGHICNCSYAVRRDCRGQQIGEQLVKDSLSQGKTCGFRILQFNAVVASNAPALRLYRKIGFTPLGTIPGGFLLKDGTYEDIVPHFISLV